MCVGTPSASAPSAAQVRLGLGARVGLAAPDHDLGAAARESLGDRPPDPARPAGHDRDAVAHVEQRLELRLVHQSLSLVATRVEPRVGQVEREPGASAPIEHELGARAQSRDSSDAR